MRSPLSLAAPVAMLLCCACSSSGPGQGMERGACFPNGTCMSGLTCLSDVCVNMGSPDSGTPASLDASVGQVGDAGLDAGQPAAGPDASVPTLETNCSDGIDNDGDGLTDCWDLNCQLIDVNCKPYVPPVCGTQKDCGDIVQEVATKVCLGGKCVAPGEATFKGDPVTAQVLFDIAFSAVPASKPQTTVLRFIYPKKLDGSILSCADIVGLGNCVDQTTRSRIDNDGDLNQVFRSIYPLDFGGCSGATCQFTNMSATVPKGASYILYGEAWYGPRDSTDLNNPTGLCADSYCIEGKTVSVSGTHYSLSFTLH